ncbi:hypothetical protein E2C01_066073 [Portunus trituberculatus]|uniref:Uncharacterized protein n=1 Tax=Portunus trituberculatus TaxID=210409 RepID=A0A5B7HTJ0_PORTR|nr:hypothetical protein [Portunus trituberculatus]
MGIPLQPTIYQDVMASKCGGRAKRQDEAGMDGALCLDSPFSLHAATVSSPSLLLVTPGPQARILPSKLGGVGTTAGELLGCPTP